MLKMTSTAVVWCCALLVFACHGSPTEPTATPLRAGKWAGNDVAIHVADDHVDFTTSRCVHGFMNRPLVDSHGNFTGDAAVVAWIGPPPQSPPHAVVTGNVHGDTITLMARYDNGSTVGPFTATYNSADPTFSPCPP